LYGSSPPTRPAFNGVLDNPSTHICTVFIVFRDFVVVSPAGALESTPSAEGGKVGILNEEVAGGIVGMLPELAMVTGGW
jgi:hypothetical protein